MLPNLTQRQVILALMLLQLVGTLLLFLAQLFFYPDPNGLLASLVALAVFSVLLFSYWRGWQAARYLNVVVTTMVVGLGMPYTNVVDTTALLVMAPAAIALVFTNPLWTLISAMGVLLVMALRVGGETAYTNDLRTVISYWLVVGSMILSRLVTDNTQRAAAAERAWAETALARAETQAAELQARAAELQAQNERQTRLLELVAALETPAVSLAEGILLAPIVGSLDEQRAEQLAARLLEAVHRRRIQIVILDIAGAAGLDAEAAGRLMSTIQALRLLGCEVTLTGVSAQAAATLSRLHSLIRGLPTARSPQEVLARYAAASPGVSLNGKG